MKYKKDVTGATDLSNTAIKIFNIGKYYRSSRYPKFIFWFFRTVPVNIFTDDDFKEPSQKSPKIQAAPVNVQILSLTYSKLNIILIIMLQEAQQLIKDEDLNLLDSKVFVEQLKACRKK